MKTLHYMCKQLPWAETTFETLSGWSSASTLIVPPAISAALAVGNCTRILSLKSDCSTPWLLLVLLFSESGTDRQATNLLTAPSSQKTSDLENALDKTYIVTSCALWGRHILSIYITSTRSRGCENTVLLNVVVHNNNDTRRALWSFRFGPAALTSVEHQSNTAHVHPQFGFRCRWGRPAPPDASVRQLKQNRTMKIRSLH